MSARYFALIALGILFLGCTGGPSPKDALLASLDKAGKLNSLSAEIDLNLTSVSGSGTSVTSASISQKMSGGRIMADIKMTGIPDLEGTQIRTYTLANGTYLCGKTDKWDCVQVNSSSVGQDTPGPLAFTQQSKKLLDGGALEFIGGTESREIAGRKCTFITARINSTKALEADPGSLPANVKSAMISQCLDDETGIALAGKLAVEEEAQDGSSAASQLEFFVKSLEPNAQVPEDAFSLPS